MSLEGYPVVIDEQVVWGEMDAFQHVNNTVYFRYFESARIAYFGAVGYLEWMKAEGSGPILASTRCRFRRPHPCRPHQRPSLGAGQAPRAQAPRRAECGRARR